MTGPLRRVHLRLPATSANLGPAFDTAAVALNLHLELSAQPGTAFSITARGRNAKACGRVEGNLIVETYRQILRANNRVVHPLHLDVDNEIPLGMGCGSSAAARLAGISLAVEFGELGWPEEEILAVATYLEGHPDNVSACWLGGMTVAAVCRGGHDAKAQGILRGLAPSVDATRLDVPEFWRAVVVLPREPIRTEDSRKVLPEQYSRADVVANLQRCALLVAAFGSGQKELLRAGMQDCLHEPYRSAICPLLGRLRPLAGSSATSAGILSVSLSGAGPGVLLIVKRDVDPNALDRQVKKTVGGEGTVEILQCGFASRGARFYALMERELTKP